MTDTTDIEALVTRLRDQAHGSPHFILTCLTEAADTLERQQAVVEAAREVVKMCRKIPVTDGERLDELKAVLARPDVQAVLEGVKE